jgi:SagB-type dehydrogenase family enzyme
MIYKKSIPVFLIAAVLVLIFILSGNAGEIKVIYPAGTQVTELPKPAEKGSISVEEAIMKRRSKREFRDQKLTTEQISQLLYAAQGINDPEGKKRTVPSAMAIYPLEIYAVCPEAVYHYIPNGHMIEKVVDGDFRSRMSNRTGAGMYIAITGIFSRFPEKFGEKSRDFTFMEAGHCAQNILLQAVALGLGAVPTAGFPEKDVSEILNLSTECKPIYVIPVGWVK